MLPETSPPAKCMPTQRRVAELRGWQGSCLHDLIVSPGMHMRPECASQRWPWQSRAWSPREAGRAQRQPRLARRARLVHAQLWGQVAGAQAAARRVAARRARKALGRDGHGHAVRLRAPVGQRAQWDSGSMQSCRRPVPQLHMADTPDPRVAHAELSAPVARRARRVATRSSQCIVTSFTLAAVSLMGRCLRARCGELQWKPAGAADERIRGR